MRVPHTESNLFEKYGLVYYENIKTSWLLTICVPPSVKHFNIIGWTYDVTWKPIIYTYTVSRIYTQHTALSSKFINVTNCKRLYNSCQRRRFTQPCCSEHWSKAIDVGKSLEQYLGNRRLAIHVKNGNSNTHSKPVELSF